MKRKVIQLAGNTLLVSLPKKWTEKHNIKKGDEIDVEEKGSVLAIASTSKNKEQKTSIDLRNVEKRTVVYILSGLHRKGFDEIEVAYNQESTLEVIHNLIREVFVGFMIVHQEKNNVVIRSIAPTNPNEFDATLRRDFLITLSLGESSLQLLKEKKFKELETLLPMEKTNNQLSAFCQRAIVKYGITGETDFFLYLVPYNLNKIGDAYRDICIYGSKLKSVSKDVLKIYAETNEMLYLFYQLYYAFSKESMNEISKSRNHLSENITGMIQHTKKEEIVIVMNLNEIGRRISNLLASTTAMKL